MKRNSILTLIVCFLIGSLLVWFVWARIDSPFTTVQQPDDDTPTPLATNNVTSQVSEGSDVTVGQAVYEANCIACHGADGRANTPSAENLDPPPTDLTEVVPDHTNDELLQIINKGVEGTAMPAWEETLTTNQRRAVVDYLHVLASPEAADTAQPTSSPIPPLSWSRRGMMGMVFLELPEPYDNMRNPGTGSLSEGEILYETHCAVCHGEEGYGDGPSADQLDPSPSALAYTISHQSDDYLFYRISEGGSFKPFNSAMPAFKDTLTETERWSIITYLREITVPMGPGKGMGPGGRAP